MKIVINIVLWIWALLKACVNYPLRYTGYNRLNDLEDESSRRLLTREEMLMNGIESDLGMVFEHVPNFKTGKFVDVVKRAREQFKLLLVYIHSGDHEKTEQFLKDVLFTEHMEEFVNEHFCFYVCDLNSKEGTRLSAKLSVTAYPYLGLLICSGQAPQLVAHYHGNSDLTLDSLMSQLIDKSEHYETVLENQRAQEEQREMERQQRRQQDLEYQRSLEADRRREEEAERKRLEEAERKLQEEALERKKKERLLNMKKLKETLHQKFLNTPEPSSKDTCSVRFRFSDGTQVQRRFFKHSKAKEMFEFVWVLDEKLNSQWKCKPETSLEDLELTTNYPKSTLKMDQLISDSQAPNNVVNVHELNE